jgi:hypothetical protein
VHAGDELVLAPHDLKVQAVVLTSIHVWSKVTVHDVGPERFCVTLDIGRRIISTIRTLTILSAKACDIVVITIWAQA